MMYTEEKIRKVNKIIKDMVFDFTGRIDLDIIVVAEYQFQITGVKKMISVGEYYDYLTVDIKVIGGDKKFDVFMKVVPSYLNGYFMLNSLSQSISEELQYFFGADFVRIDISKGSVRLSDEYQKEIDDLDLKNYKLT